MSQIRFQTLGSIDLRRETGPPLHAVLAQPKRLAFLAYLAVEAHGGFVRRDALAGLFWPELDEKHARQNLRQTLHELRRALDPHLFRSRGNEEVGLSRPALDCDATRFRVAIEAVQPEEALELYAGEFLPGFHLSNSREFGDWLDRTRTRFARLATGAASEVADLAWMEGDVEAALRAGRQALALSPYDEGLFRRLLSMLAESGRRAEAVVEARQFAERLGRDLGIEPSPETMAFVDSVTVESVTGGRTREPELVLAEEASDDRAVPAPDAIPDPEARTRELLVRERRRRRRAVAAAVALTAGGLATLSLFPRTETGDTPPLDPRLIAALPFDADGAHEDLEPYGEGLIQLMYHALAGSSGTRLAYPSTTFDLWAHASSGSPETADSTAMEVARRLGAGRLLRGSVVGSPDRVRLHAELRGVPGGELLANPSVEGSLDQLSAMVRQLAVQLMAVEESFAPEAALAGAPTELLEHYVAGLQAFRTSRFLDAIEHYRAALAIDSSFTPPALQMLIAARRYEPGPLAVGAEAARVAWSLRDRMSEADRAHLTALLGPRYPEGPATGREMVQAAEQALAIAPDRPQLYETLARWLLYYGPALGIEDWADRGARALDRALELTDRPNYNVISIRLVSTRHESKPADLRLTDTRAFLGRLGSQAERHGFWAYIATRDAAYLSSLDGSPNPHAPGVWPIGNWTTYEGLSTTAWRKAVESLEARSVTDRERLGSLYQRFLLTATEGRPSEAGVMLRTLVEAGYEELGDEWFLLTIPIHRALIEPGWEEAAAWASTRIAEGRVTPPNERNATYARGCRLALAAAGRGDQDRARGWQSQVQRSASSVRMCPQLIGALIEARGALGESSLVPADGESRVVEAHSALEELERAIYDFPLETAAWIANAVLAQLWWERGEPSRALAAARRRGRAAGWQLGTPAQLLIEARSSAALGDAASAIDAYEQYLRLRRDPDTRMLPRVDSARNELGALKGDR